MTSEQTMTREQVREAAARVGLETGAEVLLEERLAPYLSMRVGGAVPALVRPKDPDTLARVVRALVAAGVPHRLLGGGSNLLVAETGLDFAVVHVGAASAQAAWDGARVTAPGGMPLSVLLRDALARGLTGLEWAAGLPGSVGGAVAGNAGAFGGDIAGSVREVRLLAADGSERVHHPAQGDFRYRTSFLREGEVVLEVTLELEQGEPEHVRAEVARINKTRAGAQPKGGHSSGCIFKNPAEAPAGRLIDECGLKGRRHGGAFVSPAHGNFILNDGSATADDILALIEEVRAEVLRQRGVRLETEVRLWGGPAEAAP